MPITVSGGEIYTNCLVSYGKKRAEYEFLLYDRIPAGEVLWLRNYSEGREELPFIVEPAGNADGFAQRFIRLPDNK